MLCINIVLYLKHPLGLWKSEGKNKHLLAKPIYFVMDYLQS